MDWINTPESSNIMRFRYIEESSILEVEFQKGGVYQYFDVPPPVFEGMQSAASKGQYLGQNVKGLYRFARA